MLRKYYEILSCYFDDEGERCKVCQARIASFEEAEEELKKIIEKEYGYENYYQIRPYYVYESEKEGVK